MTVDYLKVSESKAVLREKQKSILMRVRGE